METNVKTIGKESENEHETIKKHSENHQKFTRKYIVEEPEIIRIPRENNRK